MEESAEPSLQALVAALDEEPETADERVALLAWLSAEEEAGDWPAAPVDRLALWASDVARFSFGRVTVDRAT